MKPVTDNLLKLCNFTNYENYNLNSTAIVGLLSVYTLGLQHKSLYNSQCLNSLPFFCNAILLLCNGNRSSVDLTEKCEEVRDNKCASEWRIVESFYRPVPDCTNFSESSNLTETPLLDCPEASDHFCGTVCLPTCTAGHHNLLFDIMLITVTVCSIIGLIGGIITLFCCWFNHQKM